MIPIKIVNLKSGDIDKGLIETLQELVAYWAGRGYLDLFQLYLTSLGYVPIILYCIDSPFDLSFTVPYVPLDLDVLNIVKEINSIDGRVIFTELLRLDRPYVQFLDLYTGLIRVLELEKLTINIANSYWLELVRDQGLSLLIKKHVPTLIHVSTHLTPRPIELLFNEPSMIIPVPVVELCENNKVIGYVPIYPVDNDLAVLYNIDETYVNIYDVKIIEKLRPMKLLTVDTTKNDNVIINGEEIYHIVSPIFITSVPILEKTLEYAIRELSKISALPSGVAKKLNVEVHAFLRSEHEPAQSTIELRYSSPSLLGRTYINVLTYREYDEHYRPTEEGLDILTIVDVDRIRKLRYIPIIVPILDPRKTKSTVIANLIFNTFKILVKLTPIIRGEYRIKMLKYHIDRNILYLETLRQVIHRLAIGKDISNITLTLRYALSRRKNKNIHDETLIIRTNISPSRVYVDIEHDYYEDEGRMTIHKKDRKVICDIEKISNRPKILLLLAGSSHLRRRFRQEGLDAVLHMIVKALNVKEVEVLEEEAIKLGDE